MGSLVFEMFCTPERWRLKPPRYVFKSKHFQRTTERIALWKHLCLSMVIFSDDSKFSERINDLRHSYKSHTTKRTVPVGSHVAVFRANGMLRRAGGTTSACARKRVYFYFFRPFLDSYRLSVLPSWAMCKRIAFKTLRRSRRFCTIGFQRLCRRLTLEAGRTTVLR